MDNKDKMREDLINAAFGSSNEKHEKSITEDRSMFEYGTRNKNHKQIQEGVFAILEEAGISSKNRIVVDIVANFMANLERQNF